MARSWRLLDRSGGFLERSWGLLGGFWGPFWLSGRLLEGLWAVPKASLYQDSVIVQHIVKTMHFIAFPGLQEASGEAQHVLERPQDGSQGLGAVWRTYVKVRRAQMEVHEAQVGVPQGGWRPRVEVHEPAGSRCPPRKLCQVKS